MSLYRPKNSPYWHYDFQIKGHRFTQSTRTADKRMATAIEAAARAAALAPTNRRPQITLDVAAGLYADHAQHLTSWSSKRYILVALLEGLGKDRPLSTITQRDLIGYIATRRNARSNATVNRELNMIIALWNRAAKARFDVGEMPDWKALRLRTTRRAHRILSQIEEAPLMAAVREDVRPAIKFILASGWRRAEVLGLRWNDCDLPAQSATTRIKGGDRITRPLTSQMVATLAAQPRVGPFIFTYLCDRTAHRKRKKGERYPLTISVLRKAWAAAQKLSEIQTPIRVHDLRHTRLTRIVRSSGSLILAQHAAGHRDIRTTAQYAHVMAEDVRKALENSDTRSIPEQKHHQPKKA